VYCSPWRPCCPSDQATSGQPGILRCWYYGVEQLAAIHSNCFLFNYIPESTQDSLVYPVLLCYVIRVSYAVRRPCIVTLWTCYGALQVVVLLLLLARDSMLSALYAIANPSVCPSVRPSVRLSVTRVDQSKTVERIIEILSPSDRNNILVFRHQRSLRKYGGFTPNGGAKYKGGSKN